MIHKEKRSPEIIREYFELLRWKKNGCVIALAPEYVEADEVLISIKDSLALNKESIILTKNSILSTEQSKISIRESIFALEEEIFSIEQSILSVRSARLSARESTQTFEEEFFTNRESFKSSRAPQLHIHTIWKQLIKEIYLDLKTIYSNTIQCFVEQPILAILISFATFVLALFLNLKFPLLFNSILIIILIVYIIQKVNYIQKRHKQIWQKHHADLEVERQQRLRQDLEARRQAEQQEFEASLEALEARQQELRLRQQELGILRQEMEARLQAEQQEIIELEELHQQKLDEYQQKLNDLEFKEKLNKESRLLELEEKVQEWLSNDIERLTHKAMKKLKIIPPTDTGELNALQNEPIRVLIGVTERTKTFESVIVESDNYLSLEKNKNPEIYIDAKDFESEPSYDGKNRRYGVYGFLVTFLCGNFLAYYKCYINFIRGKTVDDETCEYFYDSIVSVKIQEKSSVRGKNENQKTVNIKRLIITAKDGKAVCFEVARNRIERTHSLRLSQIDEAAIAIRDMLRQRRIDYTQTQNLD